MEKCLLKGDQNYCFERFKIDQLISSENYLKNKQDFKCNIRKEVNGSRNPLNRRELNLEICRRKLSK